MMMNDQQSIFQNTAPHKKRAAKTRLIAMPPATALALQVALLGSTILATEDVLDIDDQGTCNSDSLIIRLRNYPEEEVVALCSRAGLRCRKVKASCNALFQIFSPYGFCLKNTLFLEKFAKCMESLGHVVEVKYLTD